MCTSRCAAAQRPEQVERRTASSRRSQGAGARLLPFGHALDHHLVAGTGRKRPAQPRGTGRVWAPTPATTCPGCLRVGTSLLIDARAMAAGSPWLAARQRPPKAVTAMRHSIAAAARWSRFDTKISHVLGARPYPSRLAEVAAKARRVSRAEAAPHDPLRPRHRVRIRRVDQVSPLIRRVIANNPGPFTFTGTGTYIVGKGEVAVIDPGPDLPGPSARHPGRDGGRAHQPHPDHPPPRRPFAAGPAAGADNRGGDLRLRGQAAGGRRRGEAGGRLRPASRPDVSVCGGGATIAGPGWTLEAIATPGHTSNHICYALAEENACFSGDHIMGWSTTVVTPPDGDMGDYLASLDGQGAGLHDAVADPRPPITEVAPFIAAYKAHRLDRENQILAQLAAGETRIARWFPRCMSASTAALSGCVPFGAGARDRTGEGRGGWRRRERLGRGVSIGW